MSLPFLRPSLTSRVDHPSRFSTSPPSKDNTDPFPSHLRLSLDFIKKKNKAAPVKAYQIKNHMWIFVNALIENPAFDSQTKETLNTKKSQFGSKSVLSEEFVKKGESRFVLFTFVSTATLRLVFSRRSHQVWYYRQHPLVGQV